MLTPDSGPSPTALAPPYSLTERFKDALILAGLTTVFSYPAMRYEVFVAFTERIHADLPGANLDAVLFLQMGGLFSLAMICAAIGVFLSARYGLPVWGAGNFSLRPTLVIVAGATGLAALLYFGYDDRARAVIPAFYPTAPGDALAVAVHGAIFEELAARFGLLTLLCGLFRKSAHGTSVAIVLHALLVAAYVAPQVLEYGTPETVAAHGTLVALVGGAVTFLGSVASGWIRVRAGLLPAILFRLTLESRIVVLALMMHNM